MPRPDRLPRWAYRIVIGSYELPSDAKLIWEQIEHLDQSPEGAWIGTEALAERCGMTLRTFERQEGFLRQAGLLQVRRRGRKHASRYPVLPIRLPAREDLIGNAILALDAHLRRITTGVVPSGGSNVQRRVQSATAWRVERPIDAFDPPQHGGSKDAKSAPLKKTAVGGEEGAAPCLRSKPPAQGESDPEPEARSREQKRQPEGEAAALEEAWLAMAERVRQEREGDD